LGAAIMKRAFRYCLFLLGLIMLTTGIVSAAPGDTPESTAQFSYAIGLFQRQLFDEAIPVFKRVLADAAPFSKRDAALYWQAECFFRLGRYGEAVSNYEHLLSRFRQSSFANRAAYGLAWAYAKDNNPKSAVEAFGRVSPGDAALWLESRLKMGFLMVKYKWPAPEIITHYQALLDSKKLTPAQLFEVHLQIGINQFNEKQYAAGLPHFQAAQKSAPPEKLPLVTFYTAESLFRDKQFLEAAKEYEALLLASTTPDLIDQARYSLAWCRIKSGNPETAVNLLKVLSENPKAINHKEALKNLIELYMNLHQYAEAVDYMKRAEKILPPAEGTELAYLAGLALSRLGEFPAAIDHFTRFLKNYPRHPRSEDAAYQLALMKITLGKFQEALQHLQPLHDRKTNPELREKAIYRTGECYFNLGNMKNAKDTFERLIKEYPQGNARADALYQLGEIEYQSGSHAQALQAFSTIAVGNSELAGQAAFRSGEVLMKAHRFKDAVPVFEDFLHRFPSGTLIEDAKFKIGLCHLEMNDPGKALAAFSQLQDAKGYFRQEARFQIGEISRTLGNLPLAIQQYKAILAEEPKHPLASRARRAIGISLFQLQDFPGAEETFKSILKEYPSTDVAIPETRLWYGKSLCAQNRYEDGILEILKVPVLHSRNPLVPEAFAEAARAYEAQGNKAKAKKMWQETVKAQPSGELAKEAREKSK
jgi:TolA-binding protein